jgi:tartrate dehydratase alpha subunit/fumarate hydratase class I-like protein
MSEILAKDVKEVKVILEKKVVVEGLDDDLRQDLQDVVNKGLQKIRDDFEEIKADSEYCDKLTMEECEDTMVITLFVGEMKGYNVMDAAWVQAQLECVLDSYSIKYSSYVNDELM